MTEEISIFEALVVLPDQLLVFPELALLVCSRCCQSYGLRSLVKTERKVNKGYADFVAIFFYKLVYRTGSTFAERSLKVGNFNNVDLGMFWSLHRASFETLGD